MNKELKPLEERLHDLNYVLSYEEIEELRILCYEHSNSWCPLSDFFNDICLNKSETYNKKQAFKDLWLLALIVLGKKKELKALNEILALHDKWLGNEISDFEFFTLLTEIRDKYDLLKEALVNVDR